MTRHGQTRFDRELIDALRADGARGPGAAVRARVFSRLEQQIAGLGAAAVGSTIASAAAASPAAKPLLLSLIAHPVGVAVVAAALGGAAAGTYAMTHTTTEHTPPHTALAPHATIASARGPAHPPPELAASSSSLAAESDVPVPAEPPRQRARARVAAAAPRPSAAPPSGASLREQQALLDSARRALARGDSDAVLANLETHSQRFPASDLTEEREALAIKALAAAGQPAAARKRAARFAQRYPNSLLMPSLNETLRTIP